MLLTIITASALAGVLSPGVSSQTIDHVIHISVDGLRPDAVTALGPVHCPNFHRLMIEGAFTLNARTDCDYTNTLPNHTCQITGRNVLGPDSHGVSFNSDTSATIEEIHGSYVAGIFDVAHDNGLITALYSGKDKFALFDRSWNAVNGAPDITGEDNGRDKIDHYMYLWNTSELVDSFLSILDSNSPGFFFLHLRDPDTDGHAYGWKSPEYLDSIKRMDAVIGLLLETAETDPSLSGSTALIVTADHGGTGTDHSDETDPFNYTIQFHTWGPGIPAGADIYLLNTGSRIDPAADQLPCDAAVPPVRNGEAANLAASFLGLGPVPGSTIGEAHDLAVTVPGQLPSISITSPVEGSEYGPDETVIIEAAASSADGIAKVEFFMDQVKIGEDTASPWSFSIDRLPLGDRILTARAVDGTGYASTDRIAVLVNTLTGDESSGGRWDSRTVISPNPVTGSSRIFFSIDAPGPVRLQIYDVLGRQVHSLQMGMQEKGYFGIPLQLTALGPGVYFYSLTRPGEALTGKFILVR